jgi:signal transduction histidine kinase/ActR/RegA family two-component response regulator
LLQALDIHPIRHGAGRWLAAVGLVAISAAVDWLFRSLTESAGLYTLYYPALILTAVFCGRAPGYAALAASAVIVSVIRLPPLGTASMTESAAAWSMVAFMVVSALMIEVAMAARRYAERLERQRAELKTMLDLLPAGVAIAEGARAERIHLSPKLAALLDVAPDQNASKTGPEADQLPFTCYANGREVSPDDLPVQRACLTGRDVRDSELTLVFRDGRRVELMISAAPLLDETGAVRGAVAAHIDISTLKAAQRELDETARQKDEFIATLAHELRNPMAPIVYSAALIRPEAPPEILARARETIERQSRHMGRLLDDLLDVSRITRNAIELKVRPLDLRQPVRAAIEAARTEIEKHGHHLRVAEPDHAVWVSGDEDRLQQVVHNLLSNAAKYTDPGGHVDVTISAASPWAGVTVRDDGIGLAPEMLPRVFDLFRQEHRGRSAGLGIGLSVVRKLVEMHGGGVSVHSDGPGKGAEFSISLPMTEAPARSRMTTASIMPIFSASPTVLVVDDNRDAADALAAVLRAEQISVRVAYGGQEAMSIAEAVHPHAIVLDIGMPEIDGYQVARWVRSRPWGEHVRLLAVTGWGQAQDRALARAAGFDEHLVKPVDPEALLLRLREVYPERSAVS